MSRALFTSVAMLCAAVSARADFVPGHFYVPSERFIYEYDIDLNLTRSISMVGIHRGSTGATFSPSGNLVYIANIVEPDGILIDRTSVIEVDSTGTIVREFDLTQFGIRSGQSVEYSPTTGFFAVSDAGSVLYLDEQLQLVSSSARLTTQLIDGIAVMPDGRLVLSESAFSTSLWVLNPDLSLADTVYIGRSGIGGMAAIDNETILVPSIRDSAVEYVDVASGQREVFIPELSPPPTDVLVLPTGEYVFSTPGGVLIKTSIDGEELMRSSYLGQTGPSVAYYIPPASSAVVFSLCFGMWAAKRVRPGVAGQI